MTLSILCIEYHYAECLNLLNDMLSVVMLNVIMVNVIILNVVRLNVVRLNVVMLSAIAPDLDHILSMLSNLK